MDDIASQILHGCKLAGELETNLPNLLSQSQHNLLIDSCDQVVQTFSKAIQQLTTSKEDRSSDHGFIEKEEEKSDDDDDVVCAGVGAAIGQEEDPLAPAEKQMGSPDTSESAEMTKPHHIGPGSGVRRGEEPSTDAAVMLIGTSGESSIGAASITTNKMKIIGTSGASSFGAASITSNKMKKGLAQQKFKRRQGLTTRTMRVPVPKQMYEVPPDDGFIWRKYGQKDILGTTFPRSYYRCTYRYSKGCLARKKVQRLQEDPQTFEIVYWGVHTCGNTMACSTSPTNLEHKTMACSTSPTNLEHNTMACITSPTNLEHNTMACSTCPTNLEHNQQSQSQSFSIQLGTWSSGEVQCSATNANAHSKDMTGKEAIRSDRSDSSDSSVNIEQPRKRMKPH